MSPGGCWHCGWDGCNSESSQEPEAAAADVRCRVPHYDMTFTVVLCFQSVLSECQWRLINSMALQNEILILNGALVNITLSCQWITSLRCIYTGKNNELEVMKQRCNSMVSLAKKSLNIGVNSEHFIMDRRMLKNKGINRVKYLWEWNSNTKPCEEKLFCIFSQLIKQNEQNQMVLQLCLPLCCPSH